MRYRLSNCKIFITLFALTSSLLLFAPASSSGVELIAAPTNPYVTSSTENSISLAWEPPLVNPELVTGYEIRYSRYGKEPWIQVNNISSSVNSFVLSELDVASIYELEIRSKSSSSFSEWKAIASKYGVSQISLGSSSGCLVNLEKEVWCVGWNAFGQLGNGNTENSEDFQKIASNENFIKVSVSEVGVCSISTRSEVWCWGQAAYGGLGVGPRLEDSSLPLRIEELSNVINIESGARFSCALTSESEVWCWGLNMGNGGIEGNSYSPTKVNGISNVTDLSISTNRACALTNAGEVFCWGAGLAGFGWSTPHLLETSRPVTKVVNGTDICVLLDSGSIECYMDHRNNYSFNLENLNNAKNIYGAGDSYCAVDMEENLRCWGATRFDIYDEKSGSLARRIDLSPKLMSSGIEIKQIAISETGERFIFCAVSAFSALTCRGRGEYIEDSHGGYESFWPDQLSGVTFTTGSRQMEFQLDSGGNAQVSGGIISWNSIDGGYASVKSYGANANGFIEFPRVFSGEISLIVNEASYGNDLIYSGTHRLVAGEDTHKISIATPPEIYKYEISVRLPNGKPLSGQLIETEGLAETLYLQDFLAHSKIRKSFRLKNFESKVVTNDLGIATVYGFKVSGAPKATVKYDDGVIVQSKSIELGEGLNEIVLASMPWIELTSDTKTANLDSLVNVPVSIEDVAPLSAIQRKVYAAMKYSLSGIQVEVIPPKGAKQNCKGKTLRAKSNSSGKATLKVCATKSGTYLLKGKGAAATGALTLKVKGAAPMPVTSASGVSPALGQARIAWNAPFYTGGAKIKNYIVTLSGNGKKYTQTVTGRSALFKKLANATTYTATIVAVTSNGKSDPVKVSVGVA